MRNQQPGEPFDGFVTNLKKLIKERADSLLWDRVILGIEDKSLQECQLRETDASLEVQILKDFRATELGRKQA